MDGGEGVFHTLFFGDGFLKVAWEAESSLIEHVLVPLFIFWPWNSNKEKIPLVVVELNTSPRESSVSQ